MKYEPSWKHTAQSFHKRMKQRLFDAKKVTDNIEVAVNMNQLQRNKDEHDTRNDN
jgi:hypothetical protein